MHAMKKTKNLKINKMSLLCVLIFILNSVSAVKVESKSYNEMFENMFIP